MQEMTDTALMTEISPAIDLLVDSMATIKSVERIILFGSRARGDDFPRADVDLAVEGADITDYEWQMITSLVEAAPTLLKIDCVHLNKQKGKFLENILKDEVILYERGKS